MSVTIKKGDTADSYKGNCQDRDGTVNISGYSSVKFYMRDANNGTKIVDGKDMTVINETEGLVEYEFDASEVDTAGVYEAEVVVNFQDGDETFPSNGFKSIKIEEDIEDA